MSITKEEKHLLSNLALKLLNKNIVIETNDEKTDNYIIRQGRNNYILFPNEKKNDYLYRWVDKQLADIRKNQDYYIEHYSDVVSLSNFGIKLGGLITVRIVSRDALGILHCEIVNIDNLPAIDVQIGVIDQIPKEKLAESAKYNIGDTTNVLVNSITYLGDIITIKTSLTHFNLITQLMKVEFIRAKKNIDILKTIRIAGEISIVYYTGDKLDYSQMDYNGEKIILIYQESNFFLDILYSFCKLGDKVLDISCNKLTEDKLQINVSLEKNTFYELIQTNIPRLLGLTLHCRVSFDKNIKYEHTFNDNNVDVGDDDDNNNEMFNNVFKQFLFERLKVNGINSLYQLSLMEDNIDMLQYFDKYEIETLKDIIVGFKGLYNYKCPKCGAIGDITNGVCKVCHSKITDNDIIEK